MSAWAILVSIVTSSGFAPGVVIGVIVGQVATFALLFFMIGRDIRRDRLAAKRGHIA